MRQVSLHSTWWHSLNRHSRIEKKFQPRPTSSAFQSSIEMPLCAPDLVIEATFFDGTIFDNATLRCSASLWKLLWFKVIACLECSCFSPSGRSTIRGIVAPSIRTGMTRMFLCRPVSISTRTRSAGSSRRRRPSPSRELIQPSPITTNNTSDAATLSWMTSMKLDPSSILSTSKNI